MFYTYVFVKLFVRRRYQAPRGCDQCSTHFSRSVDFTAPLARGVVVELGKHFRVGGAEIVNYQSDLPIKRGDPDETFRLDS